MAMGNLSEEDVKKVARLAKLKLTEGEVARFGKQLSEVIEYIDELNEVDTEGVETVAQTSGLINVNRRDKINLGESLSQEEAISGTEKTKNGYFVVKAVIDKSMEIASYEEQDRNDGEKGNKR